MNAPIPCRVVTVTHSAWFWFCPVWLPRGSFDARVLEPIPKFRAWWLFECAVWFQQAINFCLSFTHPEATGFVIQGVRELREPREVEL